MFVVHEAEEWAAALAGDARAFGVLFDLHRDRVFRHVLRVSGSSADADEIAATAFFELWRRRSKVRLVDGSPLPWLLVTATNLARNAVRSGRRYRAMLGRLPRSEPADAAALRADAARLRGVLRALGTTDAALVALTALEGYSVDEAAAVVGVSPGAARTRLYRARKRLRSDLTVLEEDPA